MVYMIKVITRTVNINSTLIKPKKKRRIKFNDIFITNPIKPHPNKRKRRKH